MFKINIDELRKSSKKIDRDIPLDWLSESLKDCEYTVQAIGGHCCINVQAITEGVLVRGSVAATVNAECGTCLETVEYQLTSDVDTFLMPLDNAGDDIEKEELTPEDLAREWYEGDTVLLDDIVRDAIMLELPMNPKCHGPCKKIKGLVTAEEAEKRKPTVDPRLAALADIKLSKEK